MKTIQTHSEYSWSLIDPRPVLKYVDLLDEYIVYWNGAVMSHPIALNIAMEHLGMYPTPAMKAAMVKDHARIYYCNGFGSQPENWRDIIKSRSTYRYLSRFMCDHVAEVVKQHDPIEVFMWFDYSKARGKHETAKTVS